MQKEHQAPHEHGNELGPKSKINDVLRRGHELWRLDVHGRQSRHPLQSYCFSDPCFARKKFQEIGSPGCRRVQVLKHLCPRAGCAGGSASNSLVRLLGRLTIIHATACRGLKRPTAGRRRARRRRPARAGSVVAMPRVVLTTLDTAMLLLTLITKSAPQGTVEKWATARARIFESRDCCHSLAGTLSSRAGFFASLPDWFSRLAFCSWDFWRARRALFFLAFGEVLAGDWGLERARLRATGVLGSITWVACLNLSNSALDRASFQSCLWLSKTSRRAAEKEVNFLRWSEPIRWTFFLIRVSTVSSSAKPRFSCLHSSSSARYFKGPAAKENSQMLRYSSVTKKACSLSMTWVSELAADGWSTITTLNRSSAFLEIPVFWAICSLRVRISPTS